MAQYESAQRGEKGDLKHNNNKTVVDIIGKYCLTQVDSNNKMCNGKTFDMLFTKLPSPPSANDMCVKKTSSQTNQRRC